MVETQAGKSRLSFKQALEKKYDEDDNNAELSYIHFSSSPKENAFCGQTDHRQKTVIPLDGCGITCAGPAGEIAAICPNVQELDLAKNNFSGFKEIFGIICQLRKLEFLNLSENCLTQKIADFSPLVKEHGEPMLGSIKGLILNKTAIPLETVYALLGCLSGVQNLHLSLNSYSSIPDSKEQYPSVRSLFINKHTIKQWDEVAKLGQVFPSLVELWMSECPIENVSAAEVAKQFPNLEALTLNDSLLHAWEHIDAFRGFPLLTQVSLRGIPLLNPYNEKQKRQLLVARLPNIEKLNRTPITAEEREDAERMFIRHHMDNENPPSRYCELVESHGVLDRLAEVNLKPKESAVISFLFDDQPLFKREIDLMQSTTNLKKYLSEFIGIAPAAFRVLYRDVEYSIGLEEMRYGPKKLYTYQMKDGDEIHVWSRLT